LIKSGWRTQPYKIADLIAEFGGKKNLTRRRGCAGRCVVAVFPKGRGPRPSADGPERMQRMDIAQQCCGLSDEGIEDAIYGSQWRLIRSKNAPRGTHPTIGLGFARESELFSASPGN
jgi:hypothetical protein